MSREDSDSTIGGAATVNHKGSDGVGSRGARPTTPLPSDRSPSSGSGRERYIGGYGKLVDFLKECKAQEIITPGRYSELLAAVDDLGGANGRISVCSQQKFFAGTERELLQVLPAMGIDIGRGAAKDHAQVRTGFFRCTSESDLTAVLEDSSFNCRTRQKGLESDVPLLIHGFVAHYDLIDRFAIDVTVLGSWIEAVALQYMANPYHNWMHAIDVFQFTHLSIFQGGAGDFFNFQDILALLSAAIAHDVRHPGINNAFLVSTGNPLAVTYNDRSPLENMHASVFFESMHLPGKNFLSHLDAADFKCFRTKVIDAIMATDMSIHFELVDKLTARMIKAKEDKESEFITDTKDNNKERQQASRADRRMLLQIFLHTADLGHTCRPWDVHKELVIDLEEEFFRQGDRERELGVPIMPMMDRTKDSAAAGQGFFLDKLVLPLLEPFGYFLESSLSTCLLEHLAENKRQWGLLVEANGKKTAKELLALEGNNRRSQRISSKGGEAKRTSKRNPSRVAQPGGPGMGRASAVATAAVATAKASLFKTN